MIDLNNEMPTREEYEKSGGKPELYEEYVEKRQTKLAEAVLKTAESKATKTLKVRVRGGPGQWRAGQSHYMIPSQAPRDHRITSGPAYVPSPGIRIRIGVVSAIPILNEAHEKVLRDDPNLEFVDDTTPTHEETQVMLKKATEDFTANAQRKGARK